MPKINIPTQIIPFQQALPSFHKWFSVAKWQYVYYLLAAFNMFTVGTSLYLNHQIMNIYAHSVDVNHQWSERLQTYSDLSQLLAAMNAPGNNVFDSRNIEAERKSLKIAQHDFQRLVDQIRAELITHVNPQQSQILLNNLTEMTAVSNEMVIEAELIFIYFSEQETELAGRHMARMDHKYHQANNIFAKFRRQVSQIQQELLTQQKADARNFLLYEFAIAIAMLLMISCVTFYGHKLAIKMKLDAKEKETSIAELQKAESLLKEQKQQLQLALDNLQKTQLQLVQSEKMSSLGQLVSGIAHEVNNPVNFIHANLPYIQTYAYNLITLIRLYKKYYPHATSEITEQEHTIELEFLQDDLVKIVDSMKIGTERIRQIVVSLRNFSRMDEAEYKSVDIHEGIDSTLLIVQHRLKATHSRPEIKVYKDYANLPPVECYAGRINQVFMNILVNAIDALEEANETRSFQEMQTYPLQITISTSLIDGEWVKIAISDNGIGIPEFVQQRIFDPFFTTKTVGKGTGMGMSISYQIIAEQHRGKLECFSIPQQGTTFVIQIPLRQKRV